MRKVIATINICPECNTTISFLNQGVDKDILLKALQLVIKEIEQDNLDFTIYKDKLNSIGNGD